MNLFNIKLLSGKSDSKNKEVIKNIIAAFTIKGGALFVSLFTMPAYIEYFDNQKVLGLWFTILSVMNWILSFDLGIGNGLRNKLVGSIVKNDKNEIREYISSAYTIISVIVLTVMLLGLIISKFINWNILFNISIDIITEETLLFTVRCVFIGVMLQFLFKLISSILYALQKSAVTNFLSLITSVSQLIFVLVAPSYDIGTNLKMLSIYYIASVNLPLIVTSILVFHNSLKSCSPSIKFFDRKKAKSVLSLGGIFFWCQIMYMLITTTNEFLISQFSSPESVVDYQVYNKLFTVIGSLFMLALTPMWSAITKALNEKDIMWIRKIYKRLNYLTVLAVICEFLMILILQLLVNIWLGNNTITINYIYAIIFAIYGSLFIYQSVLSTIVCGIGKMKLQAICYTFGVILKFLIIYFLMRISDNWILVIIVNSIILLPYCVLQPIFIKKDIYDIKDGGKLYVQK